MAYPIKLTKPEGARRIELLKGIERMNTIQMSLMADETGREDLRWLWRADLVCASSPSHTGFTIVDGKLKHIPLEYRITDHGTLTLQGESNERAKIKAKAEREAAAA